VASYLAVAVAGGGTIFQVHSPENGVLAELVEVGLLEFGSFLI